MLTLSSLQLDAWLSTYLWPFFRLGAFLMVAPLYGAVFVPARIRIVLALAITLAIAPILPPPPQFPLFSAESLLIAAQQVLIGVASGFVMQLLFDTVGLGGQLLANSMGLSFAFNVDPQRGASTPALGQFYLVIVTLTFLSLDGHLRLIEVLVDGFKALPVATTGIGSAGLWRLTEFGGTLFSGALLVALPGVTALMIVNIAFGVISRAAPTLNLYAVGFPISLVFGLAILLLGLPAMQAAFIGLIQTGFSLLATWSPG
jgi:flagellar biosynthetic protein FliR